MKKGQPLNWFRLLLLLTVVSVMSGCAELDTALQSKTASTRPPLNYYAWLESADATTLENERSRLTQQTGQRHPEINLIQRAMLYSVPSSNGDANPETAMELLTVALQDTREDAPSSLLDEYTAFARIWLTLLEQQQDYRSAQANQNSDKHLIRELSVKVDRLEKQIEALATIEQRLIEREQTQVKP